MQQAQQTHGALVGSSIVAAGSLGLLLWYAWRNYWPGISRQERELQLYWADAGAARTSPQGWIGVISLSLSLPWQIVEAEGVAYNTKKNMETKMVKIARNTAMETFAYQRERERDSKFTPFQPHRADAGAQFLSNPGQQLATITETRPEKAITGND